MILIYIYICNLEAFGMMWSQRVRELKQSICMYLLFVFSKILFPIPALLSLLSFVFTIKSFFAPSQLLQVYIKSIKTYI